MPLDQSMMDELKANVAFARKRELAFGLCLGKAPETTLLVCHKTKDPEAVGRQAKKDGETNKVAYGMMTVEGKNLNLSCQGDIPTGMARRTREMLKLAGLNMKVRMLDPLGNPVEEDGEDEDAPKDGAAADPLAEDWKTAKARMSPRVEAARAFPDGQGILGDWQAAVGKADTGDLRGGLTALEALDRRITTAEQAAAQAEQDKARWETSRPKLEPLVREVLATPSPMTSKIKVIWDFILGKVSGPNPDYAAALKGIATLVPLIQQARSAAPLTAGSEGGGKKGGTTSPQSPQPQPTGGTTTATATPPQSPPQQPPQQQAPQQPPQQAQPQPKPTVDTSKPLDKDATDNDKLAFAEAKLKEIDKAVLDYMAIIPGSAEVTPATWTGARTKIDGTIAPMRGGKIDGKKVVEMIKAIDVVLGVIKTKSAEKTAWKKTLDLINLRLVPLDRHAQAAATQVAPKIVSLKAERDKAVLKADVQDFKGAAGLAVPLLAKAETVEKLADDVAHYNSIHTQRQGLINQPALTNEAEKPVGDQRRAMAKLFADAEKLATKEKFVEAIAKLDQIPPVWDQARRLDNQVGNYAFYDGLLATSFTALESNSDDVLAPYKKKISGWKKDHAAAKYSKTKDYAKSTRLLSALADIVVTFPVNPGDPVKPSWLDREVAANNDYVTIRKDFEPKLKLFKDHKGRPGIEEFYQGMERDLAQATSEAKSNKFSVAAAILKRTQAQWPEMETRADECKAYLDKKDEVTKLLGGLKGKKGAEAGLTQANALMASAAKQAQAKKFTEAKTTVEEAEQRAADAKAGADAAEDLAKSKNAGALSGIAKDIDKAIKVYDDMRGKVAGRQSGTTFDSELAKADLEAKKARDEKTKTAPNIQTAQQGLNAGIAMLEAMLPKIMAEGPYQTHLSEAKGLANGLGAKNADNCIQPQIVRINTAITEAEQLAQAPNLDFAAADAKVVTAREGARKAAIDGDLWTNSIKTDRQSVQDAIDNINAVPDAAALMTPTLNRLNAAITAIDGKKTAEDFEAAAKLAKDAAVAAAQTADDLITVQAIINDYKTTYTDRTGATAGKVPGPNPAAAQSEVDRLNAKHTQYEAALRAGNYDTAIVIIVELGWAIDAALRLLGEHATYETARSAAETKLIALRAVTNPHVADEIKAIGERYDSAVALSATEKHKPAETALLALPADCDALIQKANDWKAYDDALKVAQDKIGEMETHAQTVAIRPMATALRGKLAGAVAMASKGDLKGAKALLDEIPTEADEALTTAKAAGDVIDKAGQVSSTAIDPALLDEAQKLYDKLAQDPNAGAAKADLELAKSRLALAKDPRTEDGLARQALKASMEVCTRVQVTISQTEVVKKAIASVKAKVVTLNAHAQKAYIASEIGVIETELDSIDTDLAKGGPDVIGNRVRVLEERCAAAQVLADRHDDYVTLRAKPEVEPRLEQLEEHDHRYTVKPQIDAFRKKLAEAAAKSAAKDPVGAIKVLETAQTLAQSAWIMAEMRANNPPTPDDVKKIINGPGGDAELDAMLDKLEPDAQREVIRVAFEARFGVTLETFTAMDASGNPTNPMGAGAAGVLDGPNLKRFYDLMIKLPKDHVVNNDSMRSFTSIEDGGGGSYYSGDKKDVVMREGDAALSGAYGMGREHEVGGADDNCKPANDKEVTFFSWNTLHEVGHAVDDKLGYMKRNGASDNHGGWTEYNTDTQTIADAIAAHFKYDKTYMGQFLSKRTTPPIPPLPDNETCSEEEWDARRVKFEAWANSAFTGGDPWASNATAAKLAIGGVVYHESYNFRWSSYKLSARKQGMTGYQFRAMGEWFSELYAAYHSEKLKPTHPAVAWLKSL